MPAAGKRESYVNSIGSNGYYWSSSPARPEPANDAYHVYINESTFTDGYKDNRSLGCSVRCVKNSPNVLTFTINANS